MHLKSVISFIALIGTVSCSSSFNVFVAASKDVPSGAKQSLLRWKSTIGNQTIAQDTELNVKATAVQPGATYRFVAEEMTCDDGTWNPQLTINESSGVITGTPRSGDVGSCTIKVQAGGHGQTIDNEFTVNVTKVNSAPFWVTSPDNAYAIEGSLDLGLKFEAQDIDGDTVTYGFNTEGMDCHESSSLSSLSISKETGIVTAIASGFVDVEICTLSVTASDGVEVVIADTVVTLYPALPAAFQCDSGDAVTTCVVSTIKTLVDGDLIALPGNLVVADGGDLSLPAEQSLKIHTGRDLTVQSGGIIRANVEIAAEHVNVQGDTGSGPGVIDASKRGFAGGDAQSVGSGPGGGVSWGSGGSHGSTGGGSSWDGGVTGSPYGDAQKPVTWGSGGAGHNIAGGRGGGAIKIIANGTVTVDGLIMADGETTVDNQNNSGGGAGGSVWITARNVSGVGSVQVIGGSSTYSGSTGMGYRGGGGSGGRIAIYSTNRYNYAGEVLVAGGTQGGSHAQAGNDGTFFLSAENICDTGSQQDGVCTISTVRYLGDDYLVVAESLHLTAGAQLKATASQGYISLTIAGDATIETGAELRANISDFKAANIDIDGTVAADFAGERARHALNGLGFGAGVNLGSAGSGGGHGGSGGKSTTNAAGGLTYSDKFAPTSLGSSGGGGKRDRRGGHGGGAIKISAVDQLRVGGVITANGEFTVGTDGGGGGAGGSLWLSAASFSGSGQIQARGGSTQKSGPGHLGGGGGGGRIAVEFYTSSFTGVIDVAGGSTDMSGAETGQVGTICLNGGGVDC